MYVCVFVSLLIAFILNLKRICNDDDDDNDDDVDFCFCVFVPV